MVLLAAGGLHAQDYTTAVITGTVTNQDGQPLQGVRVTIESPALLGVRSTATDSRGIFRVPLLPNGEYTITYILNNYITRKQTMRIIAGSTANASISLTAIGAQEATIEINAEVAQIDKTDTIVQTSFSADFLEKTVGRGLNGVYSLAAGMMQGAFEQGNVHIRGGTGHGTKTLMDGMTVTEVWGGYNTYEYTMDDLMESVSLIQSPLNARYGNSDGGIISIVTSKGTNTFSGTIRLATLSRSYWSTVQARSTNGGYGYRDMNMPGGQVPSTTTLSSSDALNRNYEVTLKGPIWKDHITFAYGGKLNPSDVRPNYFVNSWSSNDSDGSPWSNMDGRLYPNNRAGTYYKAANGDVIRNPEMYEFNTWTSGWSEIVRSTYNQYALFFQVTPNHQLEWSYTEDKGNDAKGVPNYPTRTHELADWQILKIEATGWNVAYKGIIGSSGVLDASYGKNRNGYVMGNPQGQTFPVISYTIASRVPLAALGNNAYYASQIGGAIGSTNDPRYYLANGYVGAAATNNAFLYNDGWQTGDLYNYASGTRFQRINAYDYSPGDKIGNTSWRVNYQHILVTKHGQHTIDLGASSDENYTQKHTGGKEFRFNAMGRIAKNLSAADIYNPLGPGFAAPPSTYAGKFIVFNVPMAKLSDVDPYSLTQYNMKDSYILLRDANGNITNNNWFGWTDTGGSGTNWLPRMTERYGGVMGRIHSETVSYYLNDMWSINDHHSVLAGLRIDNFRSFDSSATYHKYIQPTLRFEYKYDIKGDQSRVASVSWAQYHSAQPGGTYGGLAVQYLSDRKERYWNQGTATPYLVTMEELMDPANYGFIYQIVENPLGRAVVDKDFKTPISTEIALGYRRNLNRGGFWKLTYINRNWENEFDWYPGDIYDLNYSNGTSQKVVRRVLKNGNGYERSLNSVEFEWDIPFNKRVSFGGSYTYSRLMSNYPSRTESPRADNFSNISMSMDWWWDKTVPGGRDVWAPVAPIEPEHFFKWFMLFDFSSGRGVQQSLSFNGQYRSASFRSDGYFYSRGFMNGDYPEFIASPNGGNVPGSETIPSGWNNVGPREYTLGTYFTSGNDSWNLSMRYNLELTLAMKLRWFATINVSNPFNHRGIASGAFSPSGASGQRIDSYLSGNGVTPDRTPSDPYQGVWKNAGNVNSSYITRMGGRSVSVQTGFRF